MNEALPTDLVNRAKRFIEEWESPKKPEYSF